MRRQTFLRILTVVLTIILLSLTLASTAWAAKYKVLYKFQGAKYGDGANPYAGVILDGTGNLYGTTSAGGTYRQGTVFKLTPNPDGTWTESVLHSFNGVDGGYPSAGLIFDGAGNLYGTTVPGGANGMGTVFKLTPNPDGSWTENVLHNFNGTYGRYPYAGLIFDGAGNLYGTAKEGGEPHGDRVVFMLTPNPDESWTASVIHSFCASNYCNVGDGYSPVAGLVLDATGNLYGTTESSNNGSGTVFKLVPQPDGTWKWTLLHAFNGDDGSQPLAAVTLDVSGKLYGTTAYGAGYYNGGTIFRLVPKPDGTWKFHTVHVFPFGASPDGANPYAGLVFDGAGNLWGTTAAMGRYNSGIVFKLGSRDRNSQYNTSHSFKSHHPKAGLVVDAAGHLYGTTSLGGQGDGVVFEITP